MDFASLGVAPGAQAGICAVMPTHQARVAFCLDGDKWGERERERRDECCHKYQHGKHGAGNLTVYKLK